MGMGRTLSSKCNWLCGKWLTLTAPSRSYANSVATQIEIDFGSPTHLTWVDLKFLPPQQHEIFKWNSVGGLSHPDAQSRFVLECDSRLQIPGTRIRIRVLKGRRQRLALKCGCKCQLAVRPKSNRLPIAF